jgi:hypothetical protein
MKPNNSFDESSAGEVSQKWLEPEEYLELAVCGRKMARCDDPGRGIRGLLDLSTGERFFVKEDRVLSVDLLGRRPRGTVCP